MSKIIANRFEVLDRIGQGGMGEVFRGRDTESGEVVAIKQLRSDIVDSMPTLIERFEREGEALRQLNHPNIVTMLEAVEEDGAHYLVVEYVSGGSLEDLLRHEGKLPIRRVIEIALDLADALTRAHRLKIIHRDIKPANVLLAEDGTPRLTDFGVAQLGQRTRMTESGAMIGTYAYLSPEACMAEELDTRADIWSFGVMLFQMLTGHVPFEADSAAATLIAILQHPLPDLHDLRPDVPPALVKLISQMLEKDRDQRTKSIRLVGAELETILQELDTPSDSKWKTVPESLVLSRFDSPTPTSEVQIQVTAPSPTLEPAPKPSRLWVGVGIAVVVVVIALIAILLVTQGDDSNDSASDVETVAPVAENEYMILVAQLESVGDVTERDVSRFIVNDLTDSLEDVPFSQMRIRYYPMVLTSEDEALAAASANDATVIIWGSYSADLIEVNVQIGSTSKFPLIHFDEELLRRTADLRIHMTNEQRESVAPYVLGVFTTLYTADGNGYEVMRNLAILNEVQGTPAEIIGSGVAAELNRGLLEYMDNPAAYFEHVAAAIELDTGNPILYAYQATGYFRAGNDAQALRDTQTAQILGPDDWAVPLSVFGNYYTTRDINRTIAYYDQIILLRPDDWFSINYRGALHYLNGNYEQAKADYDRAIALGPDTNFPYMFSMMLALREGRMTDAQTYMNIILTEFPDISMSSRIIQALYGDRSDQIFGPIFSAFGNVILGQYEAVITDADAVIAIDDQIADMYLVEGVAHCNLHDYAAAEAAYTRGIEVDPDFLVLYGMRAEVRLKQQNMAGVMEDTRILQASDQWAIYEPLLQAGLQGEWSCENFWNYDYSALPSVQ